VVAREQIADVQGWAFHPDGSRLALGRSDGTILLDDLTGRQSPRRLRPGLVAGHLAFHPSGHTLAMVASGAVHFLDLKSQKATSPWRLKSAANNLVWHPGGKFMAVVCQGGRIYVLDVDRRRQTAVLEGCRSGGIDIAFTAGGELLASGGWEGKLRFWNPWTGQQVLRHEGGSNLRFRPDGRFLVANRTMLMLAELAPGREYGTLVQQSQAGEDVEYWGGAIHAKGRLLAVAMRGGVRLWDLATGEEVCWIPLDRRYNISLAFASSGALVTNGPDGLLHWPLQAAAASSTALRIGPPRYLFEGTGAPIAVSKDGQVLAQARHSRGALVLSQDRPGRQLLLGPQVDVRGIAVSPDGRFAVTGSHGGNGSTKIWETENGRLLKEASLGPISTGVFSPDGKWLTIRGTLGRRWLRVETWEEGPSIPWWTAAAFAPDSSLLTAETGEGVIRLVVPGTDRELARLEDPNQDRADHLCFAPDATRLAAISEDGKAIHVWDLRQIRAQLAELGLDWDAPQYPPPAPAGNAEPLRVTVVGLELAKDPRKMQEWEMQTFTGRLFINPFDAEAYFRRGRVYLVWEKLNKALAEFELAVALNPDHGPATVWRGVLHYRKGHWPQARADFSRALRHWPRDASILRLRAHCHYYLGDPACNVADLRRCLELNPDDANAANGLAWVYVTGPRKYRGPEKALPLAELAVRRQPTNANDRHTLGVVLYRLGRPKDAVAALEKAVGLRKGQATALDLYFLAMCRHRLGDAVRSRWDYDQAVRSQEKAKLSPQEGQELKSFRAEAEETLGLPEGSRPPAHWPSSR
jgi:WD40 repeat protein/tetratricopeptide (TPR) repeat protein